MNSGFTVLQIVEFSSGRLINGDALGSSLAQIRISGLKELAQSGTTDCAFFFSKNYQKDLLSTRAGVIVTGEAFVGPLMQSGLPQLKTSAFIACKDPYFAMAKITSHFADQLSEMAHGTPPREKSIHSSAVIHPSAQIGENVVIGPGCVIEANVKIGASSRLYSNCFIGNQAQIGEGCVLFPGVTLYEKVQLGKRVRLHAGTVIGSDGFGYAPQMSDDGKTPLALQKIYHFGRVIVGDDVEMGANCTVDRGTFGDTKVGSNSKFDNQVHIAHNCTVGPGTIICGQSGLAGGVTLKSFVTIGGQSGVSNQIEIGDYAKVGAFSMVSKDIESGGNAVGCVQRDHRTHFKVHALLNRLVKKENSK